MEKIIKISLAAIFTLLVPVALIAHPGHGHESPLSPGHYVANPEHFLPLALTIGVALIAVLAYRAYQIRSKQNK
jgi:hypothetical protein